MFHYIVNTKDGLKFVILNHVGKEIATIKVDITKYPIGQYFVEV